MLYVQCSGIAEEIVRAMVAIPVVECIYAVAASQSNMTAKVYASGRLNYTNSVNKWTIAAGGCDSGGAIAMHDLVWFTSYVSSRVNVLLRISTAVFPSCICTVF